MTARLLEVRGLRARYRLADRVVEAVDGIDLSLEQGEALGLIGESGAGKSTIAFSLMGRLPPPGEIAAGTVRFLGRDVVREGARLRWREIAMVFQGAMNAFNPVLRLGAQIEEVLSVHRGLGRRARRRRVGELLEMVQIEPACARAYPHQLSGGMRQRVMIAMALACEPKLLVADEPTTNLDVITQRGILELLRRLRRELGVAVLLISHDLALVNEVCDGLAVLAAGRIVEAGPAAEILARPGHPHTRALIAAVPRLPVIHG